MNLIVGTRRLVRRTEQVWRFYAVGLINTAFGYGLFNLLLLAGLWLYAAQAIGHVAGMTFNYVMFRRHVFRESHASISRYVATYLVNYLLSLALLAMFSRAMPSPYLAGLATLLVASGLNFFALRYLVFRRRVDA